MKGLNRFACYLFGRAGFTGQTGQRSLISKERFRQITVTEGFNRFNRFDRHNRMSKEPTG